MKRNELITRVSLACLAVFALECMSIIPFVQAATASSGAGGTLAPATVDVHRSADHVHCDKTQSQMRYGVM